MRTIIVDATEAWIEASEAIAGLVFKTFEERIRHQCSRTNVNNLPSGVVQVMTIDLDRLEGHLYMFVEVLG